MLAPYLLLSLSASAASGALVAWLVSERRNQRGRVELARRMTAQVRERYDAYVLLEQDVASAVGRFEGAERELSELLHTHKDTIDELTTAFAEHEGAVALGADDADWMEGYFARRESQASPAEGRPLGSELELWEERLALGQQEKATEVERQSRVLTALTERLRALSPYKDRLSEREAELQEARDTLESLREETRRKAAEAATLGDELADTRAGLAHVEARLSEAVVRHESLAGELRSTEEERDALARRVSEEQEQHGRRLEELEKRGRELEALATGVEEAAAQLTELRDREQRLIAEQAEHTARIAQLEDDFLNKGRPLTALQRVKRLDADRKALRAERKALRAELAQVRRGSRELAKELAAEGDRPWKQGASTSG